MKTVRFLSREVATSWCPSVPSALISIVNPGETLPKLNGAWVNVLRLQFHDTDGRAPTLQAITAEDARRALDFVTKLAQVAEELVVHCEAGQSRSAGVALFFAEWLGIPCFQQGILVRVQTYSICNRAGYSALYEAQYGRRGTAFEGA